MARERASDRWITPGVIIAALLSAGGVVATVTAGVVYLAARDVDPDPMLKLATTLVAAVGSLISVVLQLTGRTTVTKVERNTGVLAGIVADAVTPAPAPAVENELLPYDDDTAVAQRVSVPPLPAFPRHRRSAQ